MAVMARPPKPDSERRRHWVHLRLTDAEKALLDQAARGQDRETSVWARQELLALARRRLKARRPD